MPALALFCGAVGPAAALPAAARAAAAPAFAGDRWGSTTAAIEREVAGKSFPTHVRPMIGPAAHQFRLSKRKAHAVPGLVITVPLGGDVAAAAGAVDEAGGGTVQLLAGTYHLTSTIPLLSNITIQGQGSRTIVQSPATPHGFAMVANVEEGISNIVIQDLVLDGNIPKGAFGNGLYNGAGVYLVALNTAINLVTFSNVEIKNTSIGLLLDGVNNINVTNSFIHDNNPGFFAHNAYFIACSGVSIFQSRFDNALTGDGLHFDFGSSVYTIAKSEFSGNNGLGILDQGGSLISVVDTVANNNQNDGFNMSSSSANYQRLLSNYNWGFGYNNGGGTGGAFFLGAFGDGGGFGQFFGYGFGALINSTTPNRYLGILGQGVEGIANTADWSDVYPGFSTVGYVDFNANHLTNGLLTLDVGAVGRGNYTASIAYSNGTASTLTMPLSVNGASLGSISFPPTGSWSTWGTAGLNLPLKDGNNVVGISPSGTAAPEIDYLAVNAPVPSPPAAPSVKVAAKSPYSVTLSWRAVPGAQSYNIYKTGDPVVLATGVTATTYTDTTFLTPYQQATYVVSAVNAGGGSAGSNAVTVQTPLDAPAGFTISAITGGFSLSWIADNGATSYNILRSTSVNGGYGIIANTTGTTYADTSGGSGYTYYYALQALNASGKSKLSYQLGANLPAGGQLSQDIGSVGIPGYTDYNPAAGSFALAGGGAGIFGTADAFHYEYVPVSGDVTMTARVTSLQGVAGGSEAGVDIRSALLPSAKDVLIALTGGMGAESFVRPAPGGATAVNGHVAGIGPTYWVQIVRTGNTVTSAISPDGITWTDIGTAKVALGPNVFVGLAASSVVAGQLALATFDTLSTVGTIAPALTGRERALAARVFGVRAH
jgi:hypothetical protein